MFALDGTTAAAGKELQTKSKVKTDVDNDKVTVKGKSETKADGAVATAGSGSTFLLVPGNNVDLASHVGQQVRISAIQVKPGHGDAEVKSGKGKLKELGTGVQHEVDLSRIAEYLEQHPEGK